MRDKNRLHSFYEEMRDIHIKYFPDWRFGQLCSNFFGWLTTEKKIDLFFPEENEMTEHIKEYAKQIGNK